MGRTRTVATLRAALALAAVLVNLACSRREESSDVAPPALGTALPNRAVEARQLQTPAAMAVALAEDRALVLTKDHHVLEGDVSAAEPMRMVEGLPLVVSVAAGTSFSMALDQRGRVWAWGGGQLPQMVACPRAVSAVAAGDWHAVLLAQDRSVWTWDSCAWNDDGAVRSCLVHELTLANMAIAIPHLRDVVAIAARGNRSLVANRAGHVVTWVMAGQVVSPGNRAPALEQLPVVLKGARAVALGSRLASALDSEAGLVAFEPTPFQGRMREPRTAWTPLPGRGIALAAAAARQLVLDDTGAVGEVEIVAADWRRRAGERPTLSYVRLDGLPALSAIAESDDSALGVDRTGGVWAWEVEQ